MTGKVVSRWAEAKKVGKAGLTLSGIGVQVAQQATATPSVIALATAGAAASATGIGLIVTGAVLTLGTSAFAATAAHKSRIHRNNLEAIYERRNCYGCTPVDMDEGELNRFHHRYISEEVLPYIIDKKSSKYHRKVVSAVPGLGMLETMRAVGKNLSKRAAGTLGQDRRNAASWIAQHLITHNCGLVQAIVAELYSFEEMLWIKDQDSDEVITLLMPKIKST